MTNDDRGFQAMLAEYESLRAESMAAIEHRVTVTNFTFAALSLLIAALLSSDLEVSIAGLALLVAVPQVAKAGLLIWLGEYERSQRAGRHLAGLERRMNAAIGEDALTWESGLKSAGTHMGYPYRAVLVLLMGTGVVSAVLGAVALSTEAHSRTSWWPLAAVLLFALILAWEFRFYRHFMGLWRQARLPATSKDSEPSNE